MVWSMIIHSLVFVSLSGGRESLLTREIVNLMSRLMTKTRRLNEAIKWNSEVHIKCYVATCIFH